MTTTRRGFIKKLALSAMTMTFLRSPKGRTQNQIQTGMQKKWSTLSPEKRKEIQNRWSQFRSLPEGERTRIISAYRRFMNLDPADRQKLIKNYERWKLMSPQEQDRIRKQYTRFSSMTSERQEKIRNQFQKMQNSSGSGFGSPGTPGKHAPGGNGGK